LAQKNAFESSSLKSVLALYDSEAMRAIKAIQDYPAVRMMRVLNESQALRAIQQLQNSPAMMTIRQFEDSPAIRVIRDLAHSPALKAIREFQESPAFKTIKQLQDSPALQAMRAIEASPVMRAFTRIAGQINHGYGAQTFSDAYELVVKEYEKHPDIDSVDMLSGEIQERAKYAPGGLLSAEFYLSLVVAIILFYLSQISAEESEERIIRRIERLEQTVVMQISQIEKEANFLVSERSLNLRAGPGIKNSVIGNIAKNQRLIEIERDRDWVKIEYFDHVNNVNIVGWAHSRYLLTIARQEQK
jgi:hypothetical protein